MRTLTFTVGLLLLLTVYYCAAMPQAVNQPGTCCFQFFTGRVPRKQIISVTETHHSCHEKGFVVATAKGKEICVSHNLDWAQKAFEEQKVNKG
ncbi:C-C motif chemokine 4 homolog [Anoplopoma fimbria]|uniref:C-C motif chemokine 4 homolog n=1 Tax=Anoplopoma fimbria TaxID=229290 RepID=UPI0023ECEF7F|nr:C-C motif chemokine 4 homolog [Anoplopoma fimbria]